jgi:hypothetical protein
MKRSRCKRAMRYREQEEPSRLECPACGGICSEAVTITLKRLISGALTDCRRFTNPSRSRSSSSGGDQSGLRCGRGGENHIALLTRFALGPAEKAFNAAYAHAPASVGRSRELG